MGNSEIRKILCRQISEAGAAGRCRAPRWPADLLGSFLSPAHCACRVRSAAWTYEWNEYINKCISVPGAKATNVFPLYVRASIHRLNIRQNACQVHVIKLECAAGFGVLNLQHKLCIIKGKDTEVDYETTGLWAQIGLFDRAGSSAGSEPPVLCFSTA